MSFGDSPCIAPPYKPYKCPNCGTIKQICMQREYVYKIRDGKTGVYYYYCSYHCWRKALREIEESKKNRKNMQKHLTNI